MNQGHVIPIRGKHVALYSCIMSICSSFMKMYSSIQYIPIRYETRWGATFPSCSAIFSVAFVGPRHCDGHALPVLIATSTSMAWTGGGVSLFGPLIWAGSRVVWFAWKFQGSTWTCRSRPTSVPLWQCPSSCAIQEEGPRQPQASGCHLSLEI